MRGGDAPAQQSTSRRSRQVRPVARTSRAASSVSTRRLRMPTDWSMRASSFRCKVVNRQATSARAAASKSRDKLARDSLTASQTDPPSFRAPPSRHGPPRAARSAQSLGPTQAAQADSYTYTLSSTKGVCIQPQQTGPRAPPCAARRRRPATAATLTSTSGTETGTDPSRHCTQSHMRLHEPHMTYTLSSTQR